MSEMEELFFKLPDRTVHVAGASTRNAIEFVIFQLTSAMIKHSCSIDLMNSFRTSLEHANLFGQIQSEITWLHKYAIREIEIPKWIVQKIFDGRDIRTIKKTVLNHDFIEVGRKLRFAVNYLPHDWTNTVAQLLESTSTASERDELERLLRTADLPNLA